LIPTSEVAIQISKHNHFLLTIQTMELTFNSITRTVNPIWATDGTSQSELQMKSALRKGDYKTLNMYFQKTLRNNALGYAYLPSASASIVGSRAFNVSFAFNQTFSVADIYSAQRCHQ